MNACRTHALSFLLNSDLQLMSSGRQTGRRLGGWGARPEEGPLALLPLLAALTAASPQRGFRAQARLRFLQDSPEALGSRGAGPDADLGRTSGHVILG